MINKKTKRKPARWLNVVLVALVLVSAGILIYNKYKPPRSIMNNQQKVDQILANGMA